MHMSNIKATLCVKIKLKRSNSIANDVPGWCDAVLTKLTKYRNCIIIINNHQNYHIMWLFTNMKCLISTKYDEGN